MLNEAKYLNFQNFQKRLVVAVLVFLCSLYYKIADLVWLKIETITFMDICSVPGAKCFLFTVLFSHSYRCVRSMFLVTGFIKGKPRCRVRLQSGKPCRQGWPQAAWLTSASTQCVLCLTKSKMEAVALSNGSAFQTEPWSFNFQPIWMCTAVIIFTVTM